MSIGKLRLKMSESAPPRPVKQSARMRGVVDLSIPAGMTSSDRFEKSGRPVFF